MCSQAFKPDDKVTFPADTKVTAVKIEVVKEKPDKPVTITAKVHACVKPTTGYPTVVTTTPPPTVVTTPVCEMKEGMEDPQLVPKDNIKTSSRPESRDHVRPDKPGWTSAPDDKKPSVTIKFPDDEPVPLGSVELPKNKNVKKFRVFVKPEDSPDFKPFNPDEKKPKEPKVRIVCLARAIAKEYFSRV